MLFRSEIGRAGRDGLPADTLTLYGLDDMALRRRQIDEKEVPDDRRRIERRKLEAMIALCEGATCRRQSLLGYFGEQSQPCGRCDLCRGGVSLIDGTVAAQKVLSAVVRTGKRFGAAPTVVEDDGVIITLLEDIMKKNPTTGDALLPVRKQLKDPPKK